MNQGDPQIAHSFMSDLVGYDSKPLFTDSIKYVQFQSGRESHLFH